MANKKRDYKELFGDRIKKQDRPIYIYELNRETGKLKKTVIENYSITPDYNFHYKGDARYLYQYFKDVGYKQLGRFKSDDLDRFARNRVITFEDNDEKVVNLIRDFFEAEINMHKKAIEESEKAYHALIKEKFDIVGKIVITNSDEEIPNLPNKFTIHITKTTEDE